MEDSKNNRWFIAVDKFDDSHSFFDKYKEDTGLTQLKRVISLDSLLCTPIISTNNFSDEDWTHSVHADYYCDFFTDLDYLIRRVQDKNNFNILSVILSPEIELSNAFDNPNFVFCGYDLVEEGLGNSALTNCGGFPRAFENAELNQNGLLQTHKRAIEVQDALKNHYPDEDHAFCDLWAIWCKK